MSILLLLILLIIILKLDTTINNTLCYLSTQIDIDVSVMQNKIFKFMTLQISHNELLHFL